MVFNISKIGVSAVSFGINKAVVYDENMPWAPKILCFAQQRASTVNCTLGISGLVVILCGIISCGKLFKDWQRLQLQKIFSIFVKLSKA